MLADSSAWHDWLLAQEGLRALRGHREVPTRIVPGAPAVRRDRRAAARCARLRVERPTAPCVQPCVELPPTTSANITPKRSTTWP